ncbi:MAG: type VI secretion system baseplate subunit TssK [Acidobacteria bacterium]|nr:MAG: type VI secretion system baseplate subunit TssK [Acidobacteriota bacterium]
MRGEGLSSRHDINWTEGMFVQPHHFQQAFRSQNQKVNDLILDYLPFPNGIKSIQISEADCENYNFSVLELEARLPDGCGLFFPGNCFIETRNFKNFIDANKGKVEVFLALPSHTDQEPNCLRFNQDPLGGVKYRHLSKIKEFPDTVTGDSPRQLEVSFYNPKILFSGESAFGYTTLKIAEVEISTQYGSKPRLSECYVPPCLDIQGSSILRHIFRETGNRLVAKNRSLRGYWKSKTTAGTMKSRDAMKVQTIAAITNQFIQLQSVPRLHPFPVYMKMADLIGQLSIYTDDDRMIQAPAYDHDNLFDCFSKADQCIVHLLSKLEEISYESRTFERKDGLLICPIEPKWLEDEMEFYICFESKDPETMVQMKAQGLKVAPLPLMAVLNQRRIRGIEMEGPVHHLSSLPASTQFHYFKLSREHALFKKLDENPELAIWGDHNFSELTTLYLLGS